MSFPKPVNGQIIRYSYLWQHEYIQGQEEGVKDRPCAVILVTVTEDGDDVVTVLPITHRLPVDNVPAIEIPSATKQRLGLDDNRSWIVLNEANRFAWPGPDLRPVGAGGTVIYGLLPNKFFERVKAEFLTILKSNRTALVKRTD